MTDKLPPLPAPYSEKAALGGFPALQYTKNNLESYGEACAEYVLAPIAAAIHYPECWDVAAYPTVESALDEVYAHYECSNEDTAQIEWADRWLRGCGLPTYSELRAAREHGDDRFEAGRQQGMLQERALWEIVSDGQELGALAQRHDHCAELSAALGWPGGVSEPELEWGALLRKVADLRAQRQGEPVARNRDEDREAFGDPDFNIWLDESVTENGEFTVWHSLKSTQDAYAGFGACLDYISKHIVRAIERAHGITPKEST